MGFQLLMTESNRSHLSKSLKKQSTHSDSRDPSGDQLRRFQGEDEQSCSS